MSKLSPIPGAVRFKRNVDSSGGPNECWLWLRSSNTNGYGQFRYEGRVLKAHRYAVCVELNVTSEQLTKAQVDIHHSCENKLCCNPAHLMLIDSRTHDQLHARDLSRRIKREV